MTDEEAEERMLNTVEQNTSVAEHLLKKPITRYAEIVELVGVRA
jgi:hypothetical protein